MNKLILVISAMLIGQVTFAQNEDDALRYSQTFFGGTARSTGMAGANTAFGGDFSVVGQNPAGLARIRKSNFSATLNIESLNSTSDFYGAMIKDNGTAGNFSNLSYVKAYKLDPKKYNNWYSVQLGVGLTRIKSFQQRINYSGSSDSSILHSFIKEANGTHEDLIYDYHPFTAGLAYEVYAIDPVDGNQYTTGFSSGKAIHDRSITRRGGMTEYNFSLSGNYANKLYLGASFNMTKVKYNESFKHNEAYTDTALSLESILYTGRLDIEGMGYSLRIGAIYLPVEWLSLGVAAQLPTYYKLSDTWSNNMSAIVDGVTENTDPEFLPSGAYDYRVITPFKTNFSLGIVLEKFGSIGIEVEYVDYASALLKDSKYSKEPYSFTAENFQIENIYRSVLNYKIGAEARVNSQLYLRGGFAFYDSPYEQGKGNNLYPTLFYTGGIGYNWGEVYLDASCVIKQTTSDYFAYDPSIDGSQATINENNLRFKLSLGIRID